MSVNYLPNLDPELHEGTYVFVIVPLTEDVSGLDVIATMREEEGMTLVLSESIAEQRGYESIYRCAWITLRVNSDLDAVGLTAAFARSLADESIACNVIAGARHDHLFVPVDRAVDALGCLQQLQRRSAEG